MISVLFKTVLIVTAIFLPKAEAFDWQFWEWDYEPVKFWEWDYEPVKFWKNEDYFKATLQIHNNCDKDIFVERFSHTLSNEKYSTTKENFTVEAHSYSQVFDFWYQMGLFGSWDYWYIQVVINGTVYKVRSNIRCDIGSEDIKGITLLRVTLEKEDAHFQVVPPETSQCTFNLYPDSSTRWEIAMYSSRALNNAVFSLATWKSPKKGFFRIHNNCDTDLFVSEVSHHSHRVSDDSVYSNIGGRNVPIIKAHEYSEKYEFTYRFDEDLMRDYWYIRVLDLDGSMLQVGPNFWCNVTRNEDADSTTVLQVTLTNYTKEFKVIPPSEAECSTTLSSHEK